MSYQYRADEFAPIELKDGEPDPTEIVTKAVEGIETKVNERLAAIETKAADATKMAGRLDKLEARLNRPGASDETKTADEIERKAYVSFVRRGEGKMSADELKTLTVATDANGGYLAPTAIGTELIKLLKQFSPIRAYARTMSIGAQAIKYPRKVSGTTGYWVGEIDDRTASQPVFEQITLTPHELATYTDISNWLLEDNAFDLEGELIADFAEAFGTAEGQAFINGDGGAKPKGLLVASGIMTLKTGSATGFVTDASGATNAAASIIDMYHALPSVHAQNGVWMMNRNTLGALRLTQDASGRFILADPISAGMPTTLLGRPIVEMVDMPNIGANAYPIVFGDLQGYRIVDRVGFVTLRDPYTLATKGQTRINVRKRVGGDVTHPDRFVKLKIAA